MQLIDRIRSESTPFAIRFPTMFAYRAARDWKQARELCGRGALRPMRLLGLPRRRKSDTVFVLGSGPSINGMRARDWDVIRGHDSIGFNYWPLHDFVPDLYFTETPRHGDRADALYALLAARDERYRDVPVIVKMMRPFSPESLPPAMRRNAYLAAGLELPVYDAAEFRRGVRWLERTRAWQPLLDANIVPFGRATVDYLVILAALAGWRRIVLCGIDLNRPDYFFEVDPSYRESGLPVPPPAGHRNVHKTLDPGFGQVTVDAALEVLRREFLEPRGVSVLVASADSALYPAFPLYEPLRATAASSASAGADA